MNNSPYKERRYFGMALDPIHIGTGGYRLGRVDNTIARDTGTNLPIIFGSSIEGTARTYAYYVGTTLRDERRDTKGIYETMTPHCAGKGDPRKGKPQCGKCAVCVAFGYTEAEDDRSLHGMAQFSDGKVLFFPVSTMIGPVWVTSPSCLKEAEICPQKSDPENWLALNRELSTAKEKKRIESIWTSDNLKSKSLHGKLNLGWLYLDYKELDSNFPGPKDWSIRENGEEICLKDMSKSLEEILERIVIVSDTLFPQIVNSNLEVRTSVSINPETGAAEEHALFTYEAIPRTTIMYFDVVFNNPKHFEGIPDSLKDFGTIRSTVESAFSLFEHLGVGGMGTRGFGRLRILNLECDKDGTGR
jgi:CRISPR-associated protein Cmr4